MRNSITMVTLDRPDSLTFYGLSSTRTLRRSTKEIVDFSDPKSATIEVLSSLPDGTLVRVGTKGMQGYYEALMMQGQMIHGTVISTPEGSERFHTGLFLGHRFVPGVTREFKGTAGFVPGLWYDGLFVPGLAVFRSFGAPINAGFIPGIYTHASTASKLVNWLPRLAGANIAFYDPIDKISFIPGLTKDSFFRSGNFRTTFPKQVLKSAGLLEKRRFGMPSTADPKWGLTMSDDAYHGALKGAAICAVGVAFSIIPEPTTTAAGLGLMASCTSLGALMGEIVGKTMERMMDSREPTTTVPEPKEVNLTVVIPQDANVEITVEGSNVSINSTSNSLNTWPSNTTPPSEEQCIIEADQEGNVTESLGDHSIETKSVEVTPAVEEPGEEVAPLEGSTDFPSDGPDDDPIGYDISSIPPDLMELIVLYFPARKTFSSPIDKVAHYIDPNMPPEAKKNRPILDLDRGTLVYPTENEEGSTASNNIYRPQPNPAVDPIETEGLSN